MLGKTGDELTVKKSGQVLHAVGFDPMLGFYHRPRYGRPSLALDLAESFRRARCRSVPSRGAPSGPPRRNATEGIRSSDPAMARAHARCGRRRKLAKNFANFS